MRAKTAPAGSETRLYEAEAKAPGRFSTRIRRVRSGFTQAGIASWVPLDFVEACVEGLLPLVGVGEGVVEMAEGDMVNCEIRRGVKRREIGVSELDDRVAACGRGGFSTL